MRTFLLGATIAGALACLGAPAARAVGETPTVDGNLADLIAAVNANLGSDKGGFDFTDPPNDVFTGTCAYVNGYDIVKSYAYFRFKNGSGAYTPNDVTLYLGWQVTGQIGDVDGDGNADTFDSTGPGTGCALSDGGGNTGCASGIGVGESYSILLNLNCSGADDLRLGVSNNKVGILTAGGDLQTELAGAVFCRVGSFLEVSIPHYENLLKSAPLQSIGATLCQANLRMVANAGDDLLAEDTTPVQQLRIPGSIAITKLPASQDACPGTNVSWTIQVCNDGICPFGTVTVSDTLDTGLTYVSDDKGSVQGANAHIRVWTFSNMNPGDCQTISLTAKVDAPCAAAVLNNKVGVEAVEPASPCTQFAEASSAHASAQVNCTQPDVNIIKNVSPGSISPGQTTTVTLTIQNIGDSVLDPINVCDKIDAGVSFDAAQTIGGSCGVSVLNNTLNGDGTRTICFTPFSLAADGSCTITYKVGCVTSGVHPDTATVTAFCKGDTQNPIHDRDQSSFSCACPADVEIGKQVSPPNVTPGQDVTVTLTISNPGTTVLDPINVCDKLDAGVSFDAAQTIGGTCGVTLNSNTLNGDGTRSICFTPFSLNPSASCTITYKVRCVTSGTHPDTATVIAQCKGGGEQDRDQDRAQSSFSCACPPDVEILKQVSPPSVGQGEEVTVSLTISNPGSTVLDPINVCDKLDAGVSFDAAQTIGGSCGVTLLSNTLNGDGTRTICFSPFSLNAGASCTISYKVACVTPGTHPDTATVIAQCKNGGEQDKDTDKSSASFVCLGGGSCPRTVGYWAAQCAQKTGGSTKFTKDKVNEIAGCVDGKVQIFSWPGGGFAAFDGFCAIITPDKPMNCKKQALRQFAGLLANACIGEIGTKASNGDSVFLNLSDPNPCTSAFPNASTLGDLIGAIDQALVQLKNENADPQDPRYCAIVECADGINNGRTIAVAEGCSEGTGTTSRGTTGGELGLDSFDASSVQPGKVELYKPIPNPFANSTSIAYAVGGTGEQVQIGIYDVAGRLVRSLVHEFRAPGQYQVSWNGQDEGGRSVTHGVYFLRAYVGGQRMEAGSSRILYLR